MRQIAGKSYANAHADAPPYAGDADCPAHRSPVDGYADGARADGDIHRHRAAGRKRYAGGNGQPDRAAGHTYRAASQRDARGVSDPGPFRHTRQPR